MQRDRVKAYCYSDGQLHGTEFVTVMFIINEILVVKHIFFFATSHGKVPCDGIADIIRSVAAGASQQRSTQDHIVTPRICMSGQKGISVKFVFSIRQHMIMRSC